MAKITPHLYNLSCFAIIFVISRLMSIIGVNYKQKPYNAFLPSQLFSLDIGAKLSFDESSLSMASTDFGMIVHAKPSGVFYPSSIEDIIALVKFSYNHSHPFQIAARGRGHSCRGQAMVENGIVIDMTSLSSTTTAKHNKKSNDSYRIINHHYTYSHNNDNDNIRVSFDSALGLYADVGGGELWIDVLHDTLKHGVAPVSWTDYLYLSVGGTLSNAGISGQAFRYGPQISNVYELDVVTGKGELLTCSRKMNQELFFAVLGGLGQFGIITRARIKLEAAPKRVKWVRMLYDDFSAYSKDQEHLISLYGDQRSSSEVHGLNYVEGSLLMQKVGPNNWRSSFFSPNDQKKIASLNTPDGILYCLEVAKYYYDSSSDVAIDKDFQRLRGLNFVPGLIFTKEVPFLEFLNRVQRGEQELQSKGLWDVPHPWLNIFIPKSQINQFSHVFANITVEDSKVPGPILIYPMNRNKWDDKMSAVTPEEDVFYTVGLLHSNGLADWQTLESKNMDLLNYCDEHGIKVKQYLPHYNTMEEWQAHFGSKWRTFEARKALFDPKMILSPGQKIFDVGKLVRDS